MGRLSTMEGEMTKFAEIAKMTCLIRKKKDNNCICQWLETLMDFLLKTGKKWTCDLWVRQLEKIEYGKWSYDVIVGRIKSKCIYKCDKEEGFFSYLCLFIYSFYFLFKFVLFFTLLKIPIRINNNKKRIRKS